MLSDGIVFIDGDFLKPADQVAPDVPSFLHDMPDGERDRLAFARWLVDDKSPTTARVIVNRIWQSYFGRGLIETPEDLGSQGQRPSHPGLLDWLSVECKEQFNTSIFIKTHRSGTDHDNLIRFGKLPIDAILIFNGHGFRFYFCS